MKITLLLALAMPITAEAGTLGNSCTPLFSYDVNSNCVLALSSTTILTTTGKLAIASTTTPGFTLDINGAVRSSATLITPQGLIAFSSVPVHTVCVSPSTNTLKMGATVLAFTPSSPIILRRVSSLVQVAGVGGTGDKVFCNASGNVHITTASAGGSVAGSLNTGTGNIPCPVGTYARCYIMSTANPRAAINLCLEYVLQ